MTDLLQCLVGLALCAFGLYRWRAVRGEQAAAAQRYVHRSVFCLGIALIVLAPATARAVEHTVAMPGLPMLMGDQLRMLAASCLGLLAARSARRHVITTALTLVTMVVLFSAADLHHASGELFVDVRRRPFLAAYNTVITLFPAWHLVALVRVTLRRARRAEAGVQRVGLRLFCAGVALGVVWTAWGLDDIRLALSSGRQTDGEDAVSTVLGLVCATLVIAGGSTSAWTPLRHWWWARRTYRALTPLWSALHGEFPQIALQPPRHGLRIGQATPRAVRFALYRRVIEIHDGLLLLRPRMETPPLGEPVTAAARAAAIVAALGRTRALNAPGSPAPAPESAYRPLSAEADDDAGEVGTDVEASQLAAISRCFADLTGPVQRRREDVPV
ncbi:MAB_1171c family putative transporter [Streptomyces sp. NPDC048696]|uniref:MAB_1171c family putative transporter n=1 Tax=Streptomyces sp. NPDC048696 TaxID=3365585 RepID=UPI003715CBE6